MSDAGRRPASGSGRIAAMSVGSLLGATIGLVLVLAIAGIGLALLANNRLTDNRNLLLEQVGPSLRASLNLENALINEETGVRGFALTNEPSFLQPYDTGLKDERRAYAELHAKEHTVGPQDAIDVEAVRASAQRWRNGFVEPILVPAGQGTRRSVAAALSGKHLFDQVRTSLAGLQTTLTSKDMQARAALNDAANKLRLLLIIAGALILAGLLAAGFLLRRTISMPLTRLGLEARRVAGGEFTRPLNVASGPREISEVGSEIDAMRQRIVEELATVEASRAQLQEQAGELTRSNAELEQFAYVASHDLQEPLRKIASFCQALKTRYGGQLDERAEQYIDFAVDGAKRMQVLINDLLTFSRVGRGGRPIELVELSEVVAAARTALSGPLERTNGRVSFDALPAVQGDRAQLISLFQNLISNALKFRSSEPPLVRIEARQLGAQWELSCADNGIGIDSEYAERIFLIFQRLHSREAYDGSGIGLALCRKIVEFHGGHMWLDTGYANGARFRFTLPERIPEQADAAAPALGGAAADEAAAGQTIEGAAMEGAQ